MDKKNQKIKKTKRTKSSQQWLKEHFSDPFVKQAQKAGYRSRAVFKLIDIQQKEKLIHPAMHIIELGAAPGGWSQIIRQWLGKKGSLLAVDILPMLPLAGVHFIQGDFCDQTVLDNITNTLQAIHQQAKVDLIVSDMAPNTSGFSSVDQSRAMLLSELSFEFARKKLKPNGNFLVKVFQGQEYDAFLKSLRVAFKTVSIRKPEASRSRSRENYLVCKGFML